MPAKLPSTIAPHLLAWYDANARDLPWRAPPGAPPTDPYRVWLSEIMLQQTQVATVKPYFAKFTARWPDFASLAAADEGELMAAWAGLGYYARARNMIACARQVSAEHDGALPATEAELRKLSGIGDYTAAAIAAIAFGERAVVVDANVERVVTRLAALEKPLPSAKPDIRALADTITPDARAGDFAQAMMDLGATICTAGAPKCLLCPLRADCAGHATGDPERYPRKQPKRARPHRHGTIFWAVNGDHVLLVRRPDKGMLGGMRALPTGPWQDEKPGLAEAPFDAEWRMSGDSVQHGFTHFTLECALAGARIDGHTNPRSGEWWPLADLDSAGLPTLFAKAAKRMREWEC
ncbi:A/G-specific adenine glycosylase [Stakelama marina]|uniref:A/G-specific adenine glycosylase n=1 Tax=Stakelama marina TaxID=2826939 RepID=UPI0024C23A9A|nr:A/G-specific adenine glycosylase [Stakelama marina]